jgi:hypothetical protein
MARKHQMTPARRAALRKAQLVSARKRRRRGVRKEVSRAVRQTGSAARAGGSLARRKAVRNFNSPANKTRRRKAVKYGAIGVGVGAGAVLGYKTAPMGKALYASRNVRRGPIRVHSSRVGYPPRRPQALTMGPKGRNAVAARKYRARKKASR